MTGDSLNLQNGQQFGTKDRDNDEWSSHSDMVSGREPWSSRNCAVLHQGAWWYRYCAVSNLNGKYRNVGPGDRTGLSWYDWKRNDYSMKRASMKIRPN